MILGTINSSEQRTDTEFLKGVQRKEKMGRGEGDSYRGVLFDTPNLLHGCAL
jgi:hypothetical protein